MKKLQILLVVSLIATMAIAQNKPLRLGVVGLSHGHVWEVISRLDQPTFEVVGVAERNTQLWNNAALRKKVKEELFFTDLEEMLNTTHPEAVIVYESINDHARVVAACAPRGIHVMVEKPLATTLEQAQEMARLARQHNILLLTNYETTWYPSNHKAFELVKKEQFVGQLSRINVYDGHGGPIEINCAPEFTDWLTDPIKNGGGAVMDFGCYGANLSTWLMDGQKPTSVFANVKQHKPAIYPNVDDDATIVLNYPKVTTTIMASWNWPINRKDMHLYGNKGFVYQDTPTAMRLYNNQQQSNVEAPKLNPPYDDAFRYLKAAVRKEIVVKPSDLSSLENNLIVVEILTAAIRSAQTGSLVLLSADKEKKEDQIVSETWNQDFHNYFYDQRRAFFEAMPDTKNEVIMLGNSITNCGQWDELFPKLNIINRGISGDITLGVLDRMDEIVSSKPRSIWILIGINDLAKGIPQSVILKNYAAILDKIQHDSPKTKVYVQSLMPINDDFKEFPSHKGISPQIKALNAELQKLAQDKKVSFIDLYTHFVGTVPDQMDKQFTNDGLHLLGKGYLHWKKALKDLAD